MDLTAYFLAKTYVDKLFKAFPNGFTYKGAVDYFSDLPKTAAIGDVYSVLHKDDESSWNIQLVWGEYQGKKNWIELGENYSHEISTLAVEKVDKVNGKGLSEAEFTAIEKQKLATIKAKAEPNLPFTVTDGAYKHITVTEGYVSDGEKKFICYNDTNIRREIAKVSNRLNLLEIDFVNGKDLDKIYQAIDNERTRAVQAEFALKKNAPVADEEDIRPILETKVDKKANYRLMGFSEASKLKSIEDEAQKNVIERIVINGEELEVDESKLVNLGEYATAVEHKELAAKNSELQLKVESLEKLVKELMGQLEEERAARESRESELQANIIAEEERAKTAESKLQVKPGTTNSKYLK